MAAIVGTPFGASAAVTRDANGWTQVTPSADSRIVYVSSSSGNDANNGLSPSSPKATIAAGDALIRNGYPDHLLLKRGDTFSVGENGIGPWKNGRSASEPIVFSYYGSSGARPVVKITGKFVNYSSGIRNYQFFKGLEIYKSNSDPASPDFDGEECGTSMRFIGGGANLRIEDCRIRFMEVAIEADAGGVFTNVEVRRNIVTDAWRANSFTTGAKISGLFVSGVTGYLIEENFFDHNGWNETVPNAGANKFSHNIYVQFNNAEGGIMRGNIITRGAAHGLQARSGGAVDRNLFALNAVGLNFGNYIPPTDPDVLTWPNLAHDNVILNGRLMSTVNSNEPRSPAIWGLDVNPFIPGVDVDGNIVANRINSGVNRAYSGIQDMDFGVNISYQWQPEQDTTNPSWPHPDADLGDYHASIGGTNSTIAYINTLRERPVGSLPWNLTAYAAINYIRAGFSMSPVPGVYSYPGGGGGGTTPVATITASDASAAEPSGNGGQFTITVSPAPAAPITVNRTVSGSATTGADYTSLGATTVVGTSGVATIAVTVIDDAIAESSETVVVSLGSGTGYVVGTPSSATVTIADNDSSGGNTVTLTAIGAEDGYVLESTETSNQGGSAAATGTGTSALRAGDDSADKQFKAIVSFDTSSIPDGATITAVKLRLRRGLVLGATPFGTHGACYVDIKGGSGFGGAVALANGDFQAAADATQVATMSDAPANGDWSEGTLNATGRSLVNKTGKTQFRVYFSGDDNDDLGNDYVGWYGGNDGSTANHPQLVVTYQ